MPLTSIILPFSDVVEGPLHKIIAGFMTVRNQLGVTLLTNFIRIFLLFVV